MNKLDFFLNKLKNESGNEIVFLNDSLSEKLLGGNMKEGNVSCTNNGCVGGTNSTCDNYTCSGEMKNTVCNNY
jgi:hypothetical protein